jgi:hypothetical protein
MAPRENLIPTPTVDKNGRQTTVYRSPGSRGLTKTIPSPSVGLTAKARSELTVQTALELFRGTNVDAVTRRETIDTLRACSDELVERIYSSLMSVDSLDSRLELSSKIRIKFSKRFSDEAGFEERLDDALYFYPFLPHRSFALADKIIRSLHQYPQLPRTKKHFKNVSSDVMTRYVALAQAIDAVLTISAISGPFRRGTADVYVFDDDKLTELVLGYPERSDLITRFIRERGTYDPDLIRTVVDGGAPAISSGAL